MNIKIENLEHTYMAGSPLSKQALYDVNLEIKSGSFTGLIGHTGSGKSTLIQHLNGLLKPTGGKIYVDGKDIFSSDISLKQLRFNVGLVFQYPEYQLFDETVGGDIAYGPKNMGLSASEINGRVEEAIRLVGLNESILSKSPFELSGGQKRRVAIAGILAMQPKVLILDEPTAGLDPKGRDDMLTNISRLHREHDMTTILVSHSMEDVARVCDHVIVMNKGTVAMEGTVKEVFSRANELTQMHLDVPQITQLATKLREMGYPLPPDIYTTSQAYEAILLLAKGKSE
ncbi:MAG: energy-coupling factor transporter ATPase [Bacillota bacterium]|nr:energy-coupling factor transporter ATPase [Bacillota bacterium]